MIGLRLTLLGGFEARLASDATVSLPTKKAQALLAYLGLRPGQRHRRDTLAALLWSEKSDDQARGRLRHVLVTLRRALADAKPTALLLEGPTLALSAAGVEVDVASFERRVAQGTPQALEHAAVLYRGDLLLGFALNEPLFEEWLVAERERLRELALDALARLLAHQTKAARTERAIQTAVRLLSLDPSQEAVHRALMRLYARQGRRGAALKQYQLCVGILQRELGTSPEAETKKLYQELLRRPAPGVGASDAPVHPPAGPARTGGPVQPDLPAAETPLFGRQAELGRLRQLLQEAIGGRGHIVTVVGEAGIGKTRLVSALAAEAIAHGGRVLIGRCYESDAILPFGPWVDACRSGEVGTDEDILDSLHPRRRAELTRLLPEASMAGLPPATDSALPLFEGVVHLIEQLAARLPLVLVLEDVHWADEMSLRLLAFVSRRISAWRALLVTTAREEELAHESMGRRTMEQLSSPPAAMPVKLSPLSRADTTLLVRALTRVGSETSTLANVEEQIWVMGEGNPFVTVEAIRTFHHDGTREADRAGSGRLLLPARVRDVVARRLDRLSARSQQVAAVAAVMGRRLDFTLLQSASELGERDAAEAVEEMVRHHVLQAVGTTLDFTHDRIREVVYERLLPQRRRLLHRALAEALERVGAEIGNPTKPFHRDRLEERIEQLAHHAIHGELWEKAVHYLRQAGLKAAARSALRDARVRLERALAVLDSMPESPTALEQGFDIRAELWPVLQQLGEGRLLMERLSEGEALAERLNHDHRRGRVLAIITLTHALRGDLDEALVAGTRARKITGRVDDLALRILTASFLDFVHFLRGEYESAVAVATENLRVLPVEWTFEFLGHTAPASVRDRTYLVMSLAQLGRFSEAAERAAEAIRLAQSTHHVYAITLARSAVVMLHLLQGDWANACAASEQWGMLSRTHHVAVQLPTAVASSAWALGERGEAGESASRLREGEGLVEDLAARGIGSFRGWQYYALGRACLLLGRFDESRSLGDRALKYSPSHPGFAAHAQHLLGDIAAHPDRLDPERGEDHYRQALALAAPRGMRPLVAHCHFGLGKLYRRTGQRRAAPEHLATASAMYREMDMRFYLTQVEAELAALG